MHFLSTPFFVKNTGCCSWRRKLKTAILNSMYTTLQQMTSFTWVLALRNYSYSRHNKIINVMLQNMSLQLPSVFSRKKEHIFLSSLIESEWMDIPMNVLKLDCNWLSKWIHPKTLTLWVKWMQIAKCIRFQMHFLTFEYDITI